MKKPSEIELQDWGGCLDTLGKAEAEMAAAVFVLYCRAHGDEWQSVTGRVMSPWLVQNETVKRWAQNPFWKPAPWLLKRNGLVTGWDGADDPIAATPRLIELLATPGLWKDQVPPVLARAEA